MLTVSDVMTPFPVHVDWNTPLPDCARQMAENRCRHLPVTQNGVLRGLLTDLVVFRCCCGPSGDTARWQGISVASDLVVPAQVVVGPDTPLLDTIDQMIESAQCAALVTDEQGILVGISTTHDLVGLAADIVDPDTDVLSRAHAPVLSIDRFQPASAALALMVEQESRHLIVLSEDTLYGVVTLFDLVLADVVAGKDMRVDAAIPSVQVDHATPTTSLRNAARMMADWKIGCLPVVDEQSRPIAVLYRKDVVDALREVLRAHPEAWGAADPVPVSAS